MLSISRFNVIAGLTMFVAIVCVPEPAAGFESNERWVSLFNGEDLDGWDIWLGRPRGSKQSIGLNNDVKQVFTVVSEDGQPAIRISGEIPGAITTQDELENYHLRVEYKWGKKNWRPNFPRDGGLLFHCVGPHGVQGGNWMESLECEVMAGHCGDFYSVFGPSADIEVAAESKRLRYYGNHAFRVYQKGGERITVKKNQRILIGTDSENPAGQWNTVEYLTVGSDSVYLVNGKTTMVVRNARRIVDGHEVPLARGRLQVISEWSELFYRTIEMQSIEEIPEDYLK